MSFFDADPSSDLIIAPAGRELLRIRPDGQVELGEGVTVDEAAAAFWDAVDRLRPGHVHRPADNEADPFA